MAITQLDESGLDLIKEFEGCILHPYLDSAGVPTIGYGQTYYPDTGVKVTMDDADITQDQADDMLLQMVQPFEDAVSDAVTIDMTQNNFNALVSFTYNIGINGFKKSTVLRLVNQGVSDDSLKAAFLMWDKAGGEVNQGLVNRRNKEYEVYIS